jgi:XTP/dITP diphosphohydrolase
MKLIIATQNKGKMREIKKILKLPGLKIVSLCELSFDDSIKENGKTFFENALKKAVLVSKHFPSALVVGEDSGLEVVALGNRPGIFSKRYSGTRSSDELNNKKVLRQLKDIPFSKRKARFCCTIALVRNGKLLKKIVGTLSGYIAPKSAGSNGFGYDPIFYLSRHKKTVAQLSLNQKNTLSHRAQAFRKLKSYLADYLQNT